MNLVSLPVLSTDSRDTLCVLLSCRDELDQWKETDTLSHLYLSFSRDESCKCKYVQDQFEACGAELIKSVACVGSSCCCCFRLVLYLARALFLSFSLSLALCVRARHIHSR